ncbi:hypothetical protein F5Y18DRAFT_9207 [Xylariaceae sp. FL1019]|nr:hypothetical protein F5Y18DRAFT_9207 [Xylariaceae sp. FL1019]
MKTASSSLAIAATAFAATALATPVKYPRNCTLPLVQDKALVKSVILDDLLACSQKLQDIAYATPSRNRVHGSEGHLNSVKYFEEELKSLGDYFDVELQPFTTKVTLTETTSFSIGETAYETLPFEFGNNGTWTDIALVSVANLGCEPDDVGEDVAGKVALIARGDCTFVQKLENAGAKGAIAAMIYNNDIGVATGTLSAVNDLIPVGGLTQADGEALAAQLAAGDEILTSGESLAYVTDAMSYNVLATSKYGDPDNVLFLGAHSDSVNAGPGINDNGSGSCGILTVAKALSKFRTNNQIKFGWWTAEEEGLLGAEYFVNQSTPEDLSKIRLYLNFDMIASPNYYLGIYDGDGSAYNLTGPAGSAEAESLFEDWFAAQGLTTFGAEFNGRSDYGPFLDKDIPCGGLDTGADGIKTEEQVTLYGGVAGEQYDQNYHSAEDTVSNLATVPYELNAKGMAHAIATYGKSWKGFPERIPSDDTVPARRSVQKQPKRTSAFIQGLKEF